MIKLLLLQALVGVALLLCARTGWYFYFYHMRYNNNYNESIRSNAVGAVNWEDYNVLSLYDEDKKMKSEYDARGTRREGEESGRENGADASSRPDSSSQREETVQQVNRDGKRMQRPHILFVVFDDLGSNDIGLHGTGIRTPVLDELARTGLFLDEYYVLPVCTPTRIAFMTGRYPYAMGNYGPVNAYETYGMPLDELTLPQVLRRSGASGNSVGYATHAVGKVRSVSTPY